MFCRVKGKNVAFDRDHEVAIWHPAKTGGCLFTKEPMSDKKPISLTLTGTGGVEMGILDCDPETLRDMPLVSSSCIAGYQFLNDVKIHKRTCKMKFTISNRKKEVTSCYGTGYYSQQIQPNKPYWLAIDVKYGEVELKLQNSENDNCPQQFSDIYGNNIQLLNDPTVARSCRKSPGSLCFYKQPLYPGLQLTFHSTARAHQGMVPGRYYVQLSYITTPPEQLRLEHPDLFDLSYKKDSNPDFNMIRKFEKEECTGGPITLNVYRTHLEYFSKERHECLALNSEKDVWLAIEVYGVEMRLAEGTKTSAGIPGGINVFDAQGHMPRRNGSQGFFQVSSEPQVLAPDDSQMEVDSVFMPFSSGEQQSQVQQVQRLQGSLVLADGSGDQPMANEDTDDSCDLFDSIRKNWTTLLKNFDGKHFVDHMFEEGLITMSKMEELPEKCTKEVLIILSKRRVRRKFMLSALEKTAQMDLEKYFFPDSEKE